MSARQPLDPLALALHGSRLIEASAGTGKTFTIAALYLRLVLGHGGPAAFPEPLSPPRILVVTFTDAATRELRERIRGRLAEAARCFRDAPASVADPLLARLLEDYPAPEDQALAARRLEQAAEWMDEAAVATIHSWCYRMLREHAFDSGSLFELELVTDLEPAWAEAVRDYWRSMVYPQPPGRSALLRAVLGGAPEALRRRLGRLLERVPSLDGGREELEQILNQRLAALEALKAPWRDDFQAIAESFREALPALKANSYRDPGALLEAMAAWAADPGRQRPAAVGSVDPAEALSRAGMEQRLKVRQALPADLHPAFTALDSREALEGSLEGPLLAHAAGWIRARFQAVQRRSGCLGFDDLLTRLDRALEGEQGEALAARLRRQFPVALVDEFQDTDPVQYRIFRRIYRLEHNPADAGLLLIGDPKQSIYAFRGADIGSYLQARQDTAGRHHSLGTNYRSAAPCVAAVNALFQRAEETHPRGAFRLGAPGAPALPFEPVAARGVDESLLLDGEPAPGLTLWCLEEPDPIAKGAFLERAAGGCASALVELLAPGRAGFQSPAGSLRPLRPRDVAVLVRDRQEAEAIRAALGVRGLRSVYLSDRESVFDTAEAGDLLIWLRACAEPESNRHLRAALATGVLGLDFQRLARLNDDELEWERRVEQFQGYRALWRSQGVLPMLRRLLHDFELPEQLLGRPGGERVLTNLLHLAELLQRAAADGEGELALVRHLAEHRHGVAAADEQVLRLESDEDLIQVVTVHKSKGLEYPLVFLPFGCTFKDPDAGEPLLRDGPDGVPELVLEAGPEDRQRLREERQAEELRLLYVALTRARHGCWLGVGPLRHGRGRQNQLHLSAFGYLLAGGEELPPGSLASRLREAFGGVPEISVQPLPEPSGERFREPAAAGALAAARHPSRSPREHWWIASYSALRRGPAPAEAGPPPDSPLEDLLRESRRELPGAMGGGAGLHGFPRGPGPGTFLHGLLEWAAREGFAALAAEPERLRRGVAGRCQRRGLGDWSAPLADWLARLLDTPLAVPEAEPVRLAGLASCQPELEFWFETRWLDVHCLDAAVRAGTLAGAPRPELPPGLLNGMLKGFVDLVFQHQGRYYVVDYKSNWLGPGDEAYGPDRLREAVLEERYDLQYALYLLALHRLLQARLPGYDYDRHMGGAIYLFLRGLDAASQGVFVERPPRHTLQTLDALVARGADREAG